MKIGILTFSCADNIGALLQAYALQHFLSDKGAEVRHLHLKYKAKGKSTAAAEPRRSTLLSKLSGFKTRYINRIKRQKFEAFRSKYIEFDPEYYTESIPKNDNYDAYIAGSDQIWNTDLNGNNSAFYLDFTDKPKYTYSASVGRVLTAQDKVMIDKYASSFTCISAREQDLCDHVTESTGVACPLTADPVFLLDKKEWEQVEARVTCPKKYVFSYVMEDTPHLRAALNRVSEKYGAGIVWVRGGGTVGADFPGKKIEAVSPEEFLYLIDHSCAVVTNSFHGAAFASIFAKDLYIVSHSTRNARLEQLANNISSSSRIIYPDRDPGEESLLVCDGESRIYGLIEASKQYLLRIIEQKGK